MSIERRAAARRLRPVALAAIGLCALVATGCRQDMYDQNKYEPLEASHFFADGRSARQPPEGTIPRGDLRADTAYYTGMTGPGAFVATLPVPLTRELLERGHERFDIFCSPCHGRLGDGDGMIPSRGFKRPPDFHSERLRTLPIGHFFDVMTNGFGQMSSYASQVPPADRWAIAAYIRALQLSQDARLAALPAAERRKFEAAMAGEAAPGTAGER